MTALNYIEKNEQITVSKAAEFLKVSASSLRKLENEGLIKSERAANGYRYFTINDLVELRKQLEKKKSDKQKSKTAPVTYFSASTQKHIIDNTNRFTYRTTQEKNAPHKLAHAIVLALGLFTLATSSTWAYKQHNSKIASSLDSRFKGTVLASATTVRDWKINLNAPTFFKKQATFEQNVQANTNINVNGVLTTPNLTFTQTGTINQLDAIDQITETTLETALDVAGDITSTGLNNLSINDNVITDIELADEIEYTGILNVTGEILFGGESGNNGDILISSGSGLPSWAAQSEIDAGALNGLTEEDFIRSNENGTFTGGVLSFSDGSLLDLSPIKHISSDLQGLLLPQNTTLAEPTTGEGYLAYDTDDNELKVYNGTDWVDIVDDSTLNETTIFDGDVTGTYNTLNIKNDTVGTNELMDDSILPVDLNTTNAPTDDYILAYDSGTFKWVVDTGALGSSKWTDGGAITYLTDADDNLAVGGIDATARFFFDYAAGEFKLGNNGIDGKVVLFSEQGPTDYSATIASGTLSTNAVYTLTGASGNLLTSTNAAPELTSWDHDASNDITTGTSFGGDLSGIYSNLQLAANAVTATEIATDAVGATEIIIGAVGADELAATSVSSGSYGSSTAIPSFTVDADGRLTIAATNTIAAPSSIDGVFNDAGNIDFVAGANVTITPDDGANSITISTNDTNTTYTANNGLTLNGNIFELGGTLNRDTTINTAGFEVYVDSISLDGSAVTVGDSLNEGTIRLFSEEGVSDYTATIATGTLGANAIYTLSGASGNLLTSSNAAAQLVAWDQDASNDLTTATIFAGDVSGTYNSIELGSNVVGATELAPSGVSANTYGSSSLVPVITVDVDGRITSASTTAYQDATTATKGVASFNSSNFSVASGAVSISDIYLFNNGDTGTGEYQFSGAQFLGANPLVFEGATIDDITTTFAITDPTLTNKVITFPNTTGTVVIGSGSADTLAYWTGNNTVDDVTLGAGLNFSSGTLSSSDTSATNEIQSIFQSIAVSGQSDVVAENSTDVLTLVAGSNVTLTTNAGTDTVTITASDTNTTYTAGNGLNLNSTEFRLGGTLTQDTTLNTSSFELYVDSIMLDASSIVVGANSNEGTLSLYSEQGTTDYTATIATGVLGTDATYTLVGASGNIVTSANAVTELSTWDHTSADDLTTATSFSGDVTGLYSALELAADVVTSTEIATNAVGTDELAATAVTANSYGSATTIPSFTVDADGRLTAAANNTIAAPSSIENVSNNAGNIDIVGVGSVSIASDDTANTITITGTDANTTYTAGNGLSLDGTEFQLGGTLTEATTLTQGAHNMTYDLTGTGDFAIQADSSTFATFTDTGTFQVDNLQLDGNTISTQDTNGNLTLNTNGTGDVYFNGSTYNLSDTGDLTLGGRITFENGEYIANETNGVLDFNSPSSVFSGDITATGGEVLFTPVSTATIATEGNVYYDSDTDNLYVYDGTTWVDLTQQDTDTSIATFLDLTDTPNAYTSSGGYLVRVNAGATALEFLDASTWDTNASNDYWTYQIDGVSQDNVGSTDTFNLNAGSDITIADTTTRSLTINLQSTLDTVETINLANTGTLNGLDAVDATTENTIEALIFDDDAENITGVWELQDGVALNFGNDANWSIAYDETTDDRLEFTSTGVNNSVLFDLLDTDSASTFTITNSNGTHSANLAVEGDLTVTGDDLVMGTNTSGYLLIADGTNFNPTAVSGDISILANGTTSIQDQAIDSGDFDIIDGNSPTNGYCLSYDTGTGGSLEWVNCSATTPGGTDTQVQYNNGGSFGGMSSLTFDDSTLAISVTDDLDFSFSAGENIGIAYTQAPSSDIFTISNSGQGATEYGVDGLSINFETEDESSAGDNNSAIHLELTHGNGGGDTLNGLFIEANTPVDTGGAVLNGINIYSIPTGTGNTKALVLGANWDYDINFVDATPTIAMANSGTLSFTDTTNTLLTIEDAGSVGNVGITGELRLLEGSASPIQYAGFKSPSSLTTNAIYTLPNHDSSAPSADYVLTWQSGNALEWKSVTGGIGAGDISAVGNVTSGAAFTATAGNDGNSLYFEGSTVNGNEIQLTATDPGSDITVSLPAVTGTLASLAASQTFTATNTFDTLLNVTGTLSATGNVNLSPANTDDITITTDSNSKLSLVGLSSGTGSALCLDGSNNVVTCTTGSGGVSGSGVQNQIAYFNGASSIASSQSLEFNGTDLTYEAAYNTGMVINANFGQTELLQDRTSSALKIIQGSDGSLYFQDVTQGLLTIVNNDLDSYAPLVYLDQNQNDSTSGSALIIEASQNGQGAILVKLADNTTNNFTGYGAFVSGMNEVTSGIGTLIGNLPTAATATTTNFSGDYIKLANGDYEYVDTASTRTVSGNYLDVERDLRTQSNASAVINVTGDLAEFSSDYTETTGTITDTANILSLAQNCGTNVACTGAVLDIVNAGTGQGMLLTSSATGTLLDLNTSGNNTTADGILIEADHASGVLTDAIDASDAEILNALNFGANDLLGTTGNINMTNFDVFGATGNVTMAGTLAVNGDAISADGATLTINAGGTVNVTDNLTADALTIDTAGITLPAGQSIITATSGALTIGSANLTALTVTTDSTGNSEVVLPNNSIGPNELMSTGQTDEYCLSYESDTGSVEWKSCAGSTYTFSDGLTESGGTVKLGGDMDESRTITVATGGDLNIDLTSSTAGQNFIIKDAGTAFATFDNTGFFQLDNTRLDGNSISAQDTNGNLTLNANGTGDVYFNGSTYNLSDTGDLTLGGRITFENAEYIQNENDGIMSLVSPNVTTSAAATVGTDLTVTGGDITGANADGLDLAELADATFTFLRNDAGTVTLTANDNDTTAGMTILPGGAAELTLGGTSMTALTVTTDSTGNAEVVLPNSSIGPNELMSTGQTDEYCLTYEASGTTLEWTNCSGTTPGGSNTQVQYNNNGSFGGMSSLTYDNSTQAISITDELNFTFTGAEDIQILADLNGYTDVIAISGTPSTTDSTAHGLYIAQDSSTNTNGFDAMIYLLNVDTDLAVPDGILMEGAVFTDAIDASDSSIVNAINVGDNTILGTTATIDFTNFDVLGTGAVTALTLDTGQGAYELQDASTTNKGLASFSSTYFTASGGTISIASQGISSTEIADNTITTTDLSATLTFADGDLLDLDAINVSSGTEGLLLPQASSCASGVSEGQICWDTNDEVLYVGNGTGGVTLVGGASGGDITAVGDRTDGSAFTSSTENDGNSLYFSGTTTNDTYELQLTAENPSAGNITVTLPNITGTLASLAGSQTFTGTKTFNDITIADTAISLSGASTTFTATGALGLNSTSANLALETLTSGNITATTATTAGLFNVLTGNLKVGGGTPGVALNGDDAYITGSFEVDGASNLADTLTFAGVATDITTATDEALTLSPNGTGDIILSVDNDSNVQASATLTGTNSQNLLSLDFFNNTSSGTQNVAYLSNNNGSDATTETILTLRNLEGTGNLVTDYLHISATANDTANDAIDVSDSTLFNAINVGQNFIVGDAIRQFSSATGVWTFEDTSDNDLLKINDQGSYGTMQLTAVNGSAPTCNSGAEGSLYSDDDDSNLYYCDGTSWVDLTVQTGTTYSANNGLNLDGTTFQLGGALVENTTVSLANFDMIFDMTGSGDFKIQDGSADIFTAEADDGSMTFADDVDFMFEGSENLSLEYDTTGPTSDMFTISNDGFTTTTDNVDGLYILVAPGNGTSTDASALHLDVDPVAGSSDDTFTAALIDGITGTSAVENALSIGTGWDTALMTEGGTSGTAFVELGSDQATGTILEIGAPSSTTITGNFTGLNVNLDTNYSLEEAQVVGARITMDSIVEPNSSNTHYGLVISTDEITAGLGGSPTWYGIDIATPNATGGGDDVFVTGQAIRLGSTQDSAEQAGISISASPSSVSGYTTGLKIADITSGNATERAVTLGSGWDTQILFNDISTLLQLADSGTITFTDLADNTLMTLSDNGATGNLSVTGDITVSGGDLIGANTTRIDMGEATSGDIQITPNGTSALVNILTGNLKVGNGNPSVTLNGEDAYVEGTLEVDSTSNLAGTLTFAGVATDITTGSNEDFTLTTGGNGNIVLQADGDISDYVYIDGTSDQPTLYWEGFHTNDPGIRVDSSGNLQYRDDNESAWTDFDSMVSPWTDAGTYLHPAAAEVLGNSAAAGANKIAGIYLGDNSPLYFGADNDINLSFSGTENSLTLAGSSSIAIFSDTLAEFDVPVAFNAAGDASYGYDLVLTNQTASKIEAYGPLTIESGESFENNNLTLTTYGTGYVNVTKDLFVGEFSSTGTSALCWDGSGGSFINDCSGTPAADYAELYPTEENVTYGQIVALTDNLVDAKYVTTDKNGLPTKTQNKKLSKLKAAVASDRELILGVTSENYGDFTSAGHNTIAPEHNPLPIALNGRVVIKVSMENGPIAVGDPITASNSIAGAGAKAVTNGRIVGRALQGYSNLTESGEILVFINPGWYDISSQDTFAQLETQLTELTTATATSLQEVNNTLATTQDTQQNLEARVAEIEEILGETMESTESSQSQGESMLAQLLTIANDFKAFVEDLGLSSSTNEDGEKILAISNSLAVLGDTTLNNLDVTGKLNAGFVQIDSQEQSIGILGPKCYNAETDTHHKDLCEAQTLYLQKDLAGNIDIFNNNIVLLPNGDIKSKGNIEAEQVKTSALTLKGATIGTATISANETSAVIDTTAITTASKVFITPTTSTLGQSVYLKVKNAGESFEVAIDAPVSEDIKFDWFIINEENED
jgi:hypothetical protein